MFYVTRTLYMQCSTSRWLDIAIEVTGPEKGPNQFAADGSLSTRRCPTYPPDSGTKERRLDRSIHMLGEDGSFSEFGSREAKDHPTKADQIAIEARRFEAVKCLLQLGADPNLPDDDQV